MLCNMIRWIRTNRPQKKIACIKVCGIGRLRDKLNYVDAGGSICLDFVDAGWPTTYCMDPSIYKKMISELYYYSKEFADILIFEVGGDLVEGNANEAIKFADSLNAKKVIVVNDAMGALAALKILDYNKNANDIFVATLKQNPYALQERLNISRVINVANSSDVNYILDGVC